MCINNNNNKNNNNKRNIKIKKHANNNLGDVAGGSNKS